MTNPEVRIGLIIPSSNRLTEVQFNRYAPPEVGIHVTRLRMVGQWHKPPSELEEAIAEAARVLSDAKPAVIVFHCAASSTEEGPTGEARVLEQIQNATGIPAIATGLAVREALSHFAAIKLVLISPYPKKSNLNEVRYLSQTGFDVIHELGLELAGSDEFTAVQPKRWKEIVFENARPEAEAYFLSCTNTRMIEIIEECEQHLQRPVVTSNQATLWACLRRLGMAQPIPGLGRLFASMDREEERRQAASS